VCTCKHVHTYTQFGMHICKHTPTHVRMAYKCVNVYTHIDPACPNVITYIVNLVCIYVMYTHTHADLACLYVNTDTNTHVNSERTYVNLYTHTGKLGVHICEYIHTHMDCWCEPNTNYTQNHLNLVCTRVNTCTPTCGPCVHVCQYKHTQT